MHIPDFIVAALSPLLRTLAWANDSTRRSFQQRGANVVPVNYYSGLPSIEDIDSSFEYSGETPPYLNTAIFKSNELRSTLEALLPYAHEFDPPLAGDVNNVERFFWKNGLFECCDAMAYYCFIRHIRPATIIEVGSGFSTLVAIEALAKNQTGAIQCIEPFPQTFLRHNLNITLKITKAQDVSAEFFNDTLRDNDVLFIDSTHTIKTGNDCLHLYLRVLPHIRRNIWIHVHDVFLPFGMPKAWLVDRQHFWTEQYVLLAFLIDNPKAIVAYGSVINALWHADHMRTLMNDKQPVGGASLWFRYNGASSP